MTSVDRADPSFNRVLTASPTAANSPSGPGLHPAGGGDDEDDLPARRLEHGCEQRVERHVVLLQRGEPFGRGRGRLRTVSGEERVLNEVEPGQIRADQVRGRTGDRAGDAELQRVELHRAAEHAGGRRRRLNARRGGARLLAEGRPARAQRLVDIGRRDLGVEPAAAFETERRPIGHHDAGAPRARAMSPTS